MNLPTYDFLSAPLWLINVLHWVTLSLHFIAMNFMVGSIVAILFAKFTDRWGHPVVQRFIKLLPSAMAATVTFGVAPLLFVQLVYPKPIYSAAIVSGWFWLGIIPVAIIAYYFLYGTAFGKTTSTRKGLYLGLALLGFVYISLVYSTVFSLAEDRDLMQSLYAGNQSGLVMNPSVGDWIFRWLHMLGGAVTVGGFFFGWLGRDHDDAFKVGKAFFLWGMAVTALFGLVYLFTLGEVLLPLMRSPGIWTLTIGIVLAAGSLHFYFKKKFVPAAIMVFVSLLMMVYTRHELRLIRLPEQFNPATAPIAPQWSIFILFLVCFLVAVGLVWYMFRLFLTPEPAE